MKVKNKNYIRNLAKNILLKNKNRTKISLLAIILTCILFTSLFSVMFGIVKSMEFQTMKSIGSVSHGAFKDVSIEDIEILSKDPDIKAFSKRTMLGILVEGKTYAEVSYQDYQGMEWSIFDSIEGRFPEKGNEVFIDIPTLKALGYKGEIGEKISISYDVTKKSTNFILDHKKDSFVVVGTYMPSIDSNVQVGQIYVSEEYCNSVNLPEKNHEMSVNFSNTWKIEDKLIKVAERNGYKVRESSTETDLDKTLRLGVNFAYFSNNEGINILEVIVPVLLLVGIVILAGYLLINNIFQISIIEDIQIYGLLKTIGMTRRQVKKLVHLQGFFLSLPSIVIGNIVGVFLGKVILAKVFSTNAMLADVGIGDKVLPLIIPLSAFFSLLTVYISCSKPARLAAKISPIDATKYQENAKIKKTKSDKFSLNKLAGRQVFSKKLRFLSIILSISLASVILNSVLNYTGNVDMEKGVSDNIVTDYNIAHPKYFRYMYLNSEEELDKKYINEIEGQEGFVGGGGIYSLGSEYRYPIVKVEGKKVSPILFGMDNYLLEKQSYIEGDFNREKWDSGDYIYIGQSDGEDSKTDFVIGDKIKVGFNGKEKEFEVLGIIKQNFSNGLRYFSVVFEDGGSEPKEGMEVLKEEYLYLNPKAYTELTGNSSLMSYGFDVEEDKKGDFDKNLKTLESNPDFQFDSRQRQIDSFKQFKNMFEFAGFSLAGILFFIGILNFINIISTDIIRNKVNLAIFEALGMTRKQSLAYLIRNSLIYSISGLFLSIVLGLLLDRLVLKNLIDSMAWTSYSPDFVPLLLVNLFNIVIGGVFTKVFYERQTKNSLIERIRNII